MTDHDLNADTQRIWDANATFWDGYFRDGNAFHLQLVSPAAEALLDLQPGERVLEIACGNGTFARRMVDLGCDVVATDFSAVFLQRAGERGSASRNAQGYTDHIQYIQCDATDAEALRALAEHVDGGRYDAVVCNMALMDMADIVPLMGALPRLLAPEGRFVFTTMHPAFNMPGNCVRMAQQEDVGGEMALRRGVFVHRYKTTSSHLGLGIIGQPEPQHYFCRSLEDLLAPAFVAGLVLDGLLEPAFEAGHTSKRPLGLGDMPEIPPVLAARLRPL